MEDIIHAALRALDAGRRLVLATIIKTSGSTPQKPGSRLLIHEDESIAGTLGGGCVEGDVRIAARKLLQNRGSACTGEYMLNEDLALDGGLVCGGSMTILLDPLDGAAGGVACVREAAEAASGGAPVALATLIMPAAGAGAGQCTGAKLLVREDGSSAGTLGDAELDRDAVRRGRHLIAAGQNEHVTAASGAEYFLEAWTAPPTVVIAGAGHVALALEPVARNVGFHTVVIDDRPEYANRQRFPQAAEVRTGDFGAVISGLEVTASTSIVVATRGHRHDDIALEAAARSPAGYVALLGSKRKTVLIHEALLARGIPIERLAQIRAPVGLDIGARTPAEIAISIVAEILMVRLGGSGAPLRMDARRLERLWSRLEARAAAS